MEEKEKISLSEKKMKEKKRILNDKTINKVNN